MGNVTLPYTITNGSTTDAVKVMANLNAIITEVNGNLESVNIKDLAVITDKLAALAVTAAKLATDAVETLKIKDGNVTAVKLATDAVETAKIKDLNVTTGKLAADAIAPRVQDQGGIATGGLLFKIIEIGDWDMDSSAYKDVSHGLGSNYKKIRGISVVIRKDDDSSYYSDVLYWGYTAKNMEFGISHITSSEIRMSRANTGLFDSTDFDATSYNRGWVTILYQA